MSSEKICSGFTCCSKGFMDGQSYGKLNLSNNDLRCDCCYNLCIDSPLCKIEFGFPCGEKFLDRNAYDKLKLIGEQRCDICYNLCIYSPFCEKLQIV